MLTVKFASIDTLQTFVQLQYYFLQMFLRFPVNMFLLNAIIMVNALKFWTLYSILFWLKFCFFTQLFLKMLSGMANSVDPDQTAVWSGSALFAYGILSETLMFKILGDLQ